MELQPVPANTNYTYGELTAKNKITTQPNIT